MKMTSKFATADADHQRYSNALVDEYDPAEDDRFEKAFYAWESAEHVRRQAEDDAMCDRATALHRATRARDLTSELVRVAVREGARRSHAHTAAMYVSAHSEGVPQVDAHAAVRVWLRLAAGGVSRDVCTAAAHMLLRNRHHPRDVDLAIELSKRGRADVLILQVLDV